MARLLLATFGSLGDVSPFIALGRALGSAGHDVTICTASRFERQVAEHDLSFAPTTDALLEHMHSDLGRTILGGEAGTIATIRAGLKLNALAKPLNRQMMIDVWHAAEAIRPDMIVYHCKALAAPHVADKLRVPAIMANLQPMLAPTGAFPAPGMPDLGWGRWYNRRTYDLVAMGYRAYRGLVNDFRRSVLGLPNVSGSTGLFRRPNGDAIPMLHAFSEHVVPHPDDWPAHALTTGYWFLERPGDWQPPTALERFLDDGDPPVYVGFGSLAGRDPEALGALVVAALRMAGARGILAKGWGGLAADCGSADIHLLDQAPHDWLFPKVAAVVHHGGAGTTAAGLRAGRPSVICPFFGDQPFWAARVHALGAGPKPLPRRRLTAARLAERITAATSDPDIALAAKRLSHAIRSEDGAAKAVRVIDERLVRQQA